MSAKTKMKDYVTKMFSTKESTSSTDRLLASQISGLAAPASSVAPLLLHSLPIRTASYQNRRPTVYQPTTVSVHVNTRYDKIPQRESSARGYDSRHHRSASTFLRRLLRMHRNSASGDRQIDQNIRQVFADGTGKELDAKYPSIQDDGATTESTPSGKSRLGPQVLAALSVSMGSLIVGYATGYTSPATDSMLNSTDIEVQKEDVGWIGGIMPLAALLGGFAGGPMIDTLGRKMTILTTAIPFILSWVLIAFAVNLPCILAGRATAGFCIGLITLTLPVYLAETVQPEVRGTLGLLPTAFGNTGILLVYAAGLFLNWWHLSLLGAAISVPLLILMCIIPETPSWYLSKGEREKAESALQWLRGKEADIQKEFNEVERNVLKNQQAGSSLKTLFSKSSFKPVAITIGLMFFQQMSGINAVIFYSADIFKGTGSTLDKNICAIIVGCVNFASTFAATIVIDRMGRKLLLYISSIVMIVTLTTLGTYMYLKERTDYDVSAFSIMPLISVVFYIIGFAVGFGPIPWLMMGELLPAKIRGPAASLATAFNWTCTSVVTLTFNMMLDALGADITFWAYGFFCLLGFIFVILCVPETRGKSLEDIERKFQKTRRMSSIANLRPSPLSI